MGRSDNRHSGKDTARQGWLGTSTHPRVCTITFTLFRVLTWLCTRLAAVQSILVKLTEERYWLSVSQIEHLDEEIQEKSSTNKDYIMELQSGHIQQGWQLEHLQADVRILLERNRVLPVERQDTLITIHRMPIMLEPMLESNLAMPQRPD